MVPALQACGQLGAAGCSGAAVLGLGWGQPLPGGRQFSEPACQKSWPRAASSSMPMQGAARLEEPAGRRLPYRVLLLCVRLVVACT